MDSPDKNTRSGKHNDFNEAGVDGCLNLADALAGRDVIFSMVTVDQAPIAVKAAAYAVASRHSSFLTVTPARPTPSVKPKN
jgi:3-hydroxyisobutyrate dehydrogenase-like beta-hydroxyacid dehydrogenase